MIANTSTIATHSTVVNAVLTERPNVSVILLFTSGTRPSFVWPLICSRILSYSTIVSLIEYPIIVKVTDTNASFKGILQTPNTRNTMKTSCRRAITPDTPAEKPESAEKRSLIYTTINRAAKTMAIAEFFRALAPIYGSTA